MSQEIVFTIYVTVIYWEIRIIPDLENYICYNFFILIVCYLIHHGHTRSPPLNIFQLHYAVTNKTMVMLYKTNNQSVKRRVQAFVKPAASIHM